MTTKLSEALNSNLLTFGYLGSSKLTINNQEAPAIAPTIFNISLFLQRVATIGRDKLDKNTLKNVFATDNSVVVATPYGCILGGYIL